MLNSGLCYSKGTVLLVILSFIVSCMRLSLSQSGDEDGNNMTNDSFITPYCPTNISCEDLPVRCIECEFDDNCAYGSTVEVMCMPKDTIDCTVSQMLESSFW